MELRLKGALPVVAIVLAVYTVLGSVGYAVQGSMEGRGLAGQVSCWFAPSSSRFLRWLRQVKN